MNKFLIIGIVIIIVIVGWLFLKPKGNNLPPLEMDNIQEQEQEQEQDMMEMQRILSYNIKDEPKIMANIKNMEMNEIKIYADKITKENVKNEQFLQAQLPNDLVEKLKEIDFSTNDAKDALLNPTTLGNAAYIAMNSVEPYKERAIKAFDFLFSKL